jgi:tetratricopeptide (TPR) repeat protein
VKRKRNTSKQPKVQAAAGVPVSPRGVPKHGSAASGCRRWFLRLFAMLLPLLALGLVELTLRLAGYGHSTAFFLPANDQGRAMLTDNPWFGWRFFPPAVARTPQPLYLVARKPQDTIRIFVLGESAAMGDPEPAYGFARQLERLLQTRHPDQKIEVVNTAMTAINSHVVRLIARDCVPREGDYWLIYAGNNEVIGPFGAGTVFGSQVPNLTMVRFVLALKTTRVGQWLAQITRGANEPKQWEGLEFFLKSQLTRDDPRLKRVYASFAANLGDIADFGRRSGATVLLATMPVNLRDFPPLASVHRPDLRPEQLAEWQKFFSAGTQAQAAGNFAEALGDFRKAGEIDDGFAELAFQRARCEMELKQDAVAESDFRLARDLDTLRFRADSRINEIIRQTAKAKEVRAIDADEELARLGDENLFYDHVHLNFAGYYRVARLFAAEVEKRWPGAQTNDSPWLTEAEVARRLACTAFDERRVAEEMRGRLQRPPFTAQSNFRARDEHWGATIAALSESAASCASNYQTAVALAPGDWVLHANFGRLLMAAGDDSNAAKECAEVTRLLPHSVEGWANRGRLARLAGDTGRAKEYLQEALKLQPDSVMVRTELGILEAGLGETENARRQFRSALRFQPGYTEARVNLGLLLANEGDVAGAAAEYREALRRQTNSADARVNLADLLATHGQSGEALTLYEQAVVLEPENPIVRYNFGRLLTAENRAAEAVTNFQVALRQQRNLPQHDLGAIHLELGNALAGLGRDSEALDEFAQAERLIPGFADVHLNYGAALARSRRYAAAAAEFREVLRLNPDLIEARADLGIALYEQGKLEDALKQFEDVLQRNPKDATALHYVQLFQNRTPSPAAR